MDRRWFREALAADTADAQLHGLVHGEREILDRIALIAEVLRRASTVDRNWPRCGGSRTATPGSPSTRPRHKRS
jgi:hypothetical protein